MKHWWKTFFHGGFSNLFNYHSCIWRLLFSHKIDKSVEQYFNEGVEWKVRLFCQGKSFVKFEI